MKRKVLEEQYLELLKEKYDIQLPSPCSEEDYWSYIKKFDFIYTMVRHGFMKEIINGEGKFGTFNRFPPGGHANEQRNTSFEAVIMSLYILMKNGVITDYLNEGSAFLKHEDNVFAKKVTTHIITNLEPYKIFIYLRIYLYDYKWANTEKDIVFDWRKTIEYINNNLINEDFLRKHSRVISMINSLNLDIKFKN